MSTVKILNPKSYKGIIPVKGEAAKFLANHPMNANQPRPWRIVVESKKYATADFQMTRQWDFHIYGSNGELLCSSKQRYENKKDCVAIAKEFFAGHPATLEIIKPK